MDAYLIPSPAYQVWNLAPAPDHYAAIVAVMNLRETLRPYIAGLSTEAAATGMPLMRAMVLQWPDDADAQDTSVEDQVRMRGET